MRLFMIMLISWVWLISDAEAQNGSDDCLPLDFLIGTELQVIGSVEAGGMPVRSQSGLDHPVMHFIEIGTILSDYRYSGCRDGRNWFEFSLVSDDDEIIEGYILGDDGTTDWLVAHDFCMYGVTDYSFEQPNSGYHLIRDAYFRDGQLYIAVGDAGSSDDIHPVLLNHYAVDATGALSPVDYPFDDVVTRELTDRLGITEYVFGDRSRQEYTLYLSPDASRILYFLPSREADDCAHYCYWVEGFVADADGSNPRSIGEIPTEAGLVRVYWGNDGRLYFLHVTLSGGVYFTMSFCIDDACTIDGPIDEVAAEYSGAVVAPASVVTTSPDGRYLALEPLYDRGSEYAQIGPTIIDLDTSQYIELPYNGLAAIPVIWRGTNTVAVGMALDGAQWQIIDFDIEAGTYRLGDNALPAETDPNAFTPGWYPGSWITQGARLVAFHVNGGLRCFSGALG